MDRDTEERLRVIGEAFQLMGSTKTQSVMIHGDRAEITFLDGERITARITEWVQDEPVFIHVEWIEEGSVITAMVVEIGGQFIVAFPPSMLEQNRDVNPEDIVGNLIMAEEEAKKLVEVVHAYHPKRVLPFIIVCLIAGSIFAAIVWSMLES